VRLALQEFDVGSFQPAREPHQQISVRLAGKQRAALAQAAKRKDASVGELIRAALEQLPVKPGRAAKSGRQK
jgi:predicted HicB family RNase H-like nuclease